MQLSDSTRNSSAHFFLSWSSGARQTEKKISGIDCINKVHMRNDGYKLKE